MDILKRVKLLLELGSDIDCRDRDRGESPISAAARLLVVAPRVEIWPKGAKNSPTVY